MSTIASTGAGGSTGTGGSSAASTGTGGSTLSAMSWRDDWRNALAAGSTDSEKELAQLQRYESPEQIWKKAKELERKMSAGELRTTLPKNATSQEVAQWRKDNGIPEKPEEYKINFPAGKQAPKEDDAFLKAFLTQAHGANFTQAQVDAAVKIFYEEVDRQEGAISEAEKKAEQVTEDKLRQEWGTDYRSNKSMAEALLARAPSGFRDRFMNGYLADHTPIKASPEAWKWLVQMEREINPASTVLPGATGDVGAPIAKELSELKRQMSAPKGSADYKHYWEGGGDKRYRELLEAQQRLEQKGVKQAA